jgi:hypothetical protein
MERWQYEDWMNELDFLLSIADYLIYEEPVPGCDPTMYLTNTYDGDLKIWIALQLIKAKYGR